MSAWPQPAAPVGRHRRLEGPKGFAPIFFGVVAEVENHLGHLAAARSVRDSRMRCISMLPDATVEAWEYFQ